MQKSEWGFYDRKTRKHLPSFYVYCSNVGCVIRPHTKDYHGEEDAVLAWNRRAENGANNGNP